MQINEMGTKVYCSACLIKMMIIDINIWFCPKCSYFYDKRNNKYNHIPFEIMEVPISKDPDEEWCKAHNIGRW